MVNYMDWGGISHRHGFLSIPSVCLFFVVVVVVVF